MREYDIRDFGAVGDGKTMNTEAIQRAVDTCSENGGGRVVVGAGIYMSGSISLRSGVDLHIEQDGTLLGSPDWNDYPEKGNLKHVDTSGLPRYRNASFIFAEECDNISITGTGKIDANGKNFVIKNDKGKYVRIDAPTPPRVVFFTGCTNIRVEDITMVNQPAGWSYWIHDCECVSFDKCKVLAELQYPNNDGIHINSSRNVTISDCIISTGDDCIVVRANNRSLKENKVCEKVAVTNCILTSYANGIRIGWRNDGVIRNCVFSNITMTDTNVGIGIVLPKAVYAPVDRGTEHTTIKNLKFNNIVMDGIYAHPIVVQIDEDAETLCDFVGNISFDNIYSHGLEFPYVHGRKENIVKNISFTNCRFEKATDDVYPNYETHGYAKGQRTKDATLIKNAENIVFNNTSFSDL